jgi:hypothetical protein
MTLAITAAHFNDIFLGTLYVDLNYVLGAGPATHDWYFSMP